jgi:CheY-like chemotaxis protein
MFYNSNNITLTPRRRDKGIGLFLCKTLTELMGGEIRLDDEYDSGIPNCPGTRFIIDLKTPPIMDVDLEMDFINPMLHDETVEGSISSTAMFRPNSVALRAESMVTVPLAIPKKLSVLFVDDDSILRKLFSRSIKALCPDWTVREAASGEAAIRLVTEQLSTVVATDSIASDSGPPTFTQQPPPVFDLIFVDMYMASVEKQLLGTETVATLREKGITCTICGLSANDKENDFLSAGADAFLFKPFPCEKNALRAEIVRILDARKSVKLVFIRPEVQGTATLGQ